MGVTEAMSITDARSDPVVYTALRWKVVFLVLAKESLALNEEADAVARGLAPVLPCSAFSRSACSFWALRPRPPILVPPGFGMKSLIRKSSHVRVDQGGV